MTRSFPNVNRWGFDAIPCNGVLQRFQTEVNDVSQEKRTAWYLDRKNSDKDITSLYPMQRDITATSNWDTPGLVPSARDLCTQPFGKPELGVTRLGVYLYRSPINDLPPLNDVKCADCREKCQNCRNCEGTYH